jgi:hypothetical protein
MLQLHVFACLCMVMHASSDNTTCQGFASLSGAHGTSIESLHLTGLQRGSYCGLCLTRSSSHLLKTVEATPSKQTVCEYTLQALQAGCVLAVFLCPVVRLEFFRE